MRSFSDQLADLLRSKRIGLTTVIAIADALAADARYNIWFLDHVKNGDHPEDVVLAKLDEGVALTEACETAISNFQQGGSLQELETALQKFSSDTATALKIER